MKGPEASQSLSLILYSQVRRVQKPRGGKLGLRSFPIEFAARGGLYAGTTKDTQTGYMRDFLGFLGMTDVEFVYAEGLAISAESKAQSIGKAHAHVDRLVAPELLAA